MPPCTLNLTKEEYADYGEPSWDVRGEHRKGPVNARAETRM